MIIEPLRLLIVDDHPAMIEGYKSILASKYAIAKIEITESCNCESAYHLITKAITPFDVVLLDLELPPYEQVKIFSGEDLAKIIQKVSKETKIMMLTSHTEGFTLYHLIKKISPEGILVKSDFKPEELIRAMEIILEGGTYYSATVNRTVIEVGMNNYALDSYDRRIITLLAKGIKTKNLPDHMELSISAVDKRKAQIKQFFEIQKGNDEDIIREARKRGLV